MKEIRVHKADRHGVLMGAIGREKLRSAIQEARSINGDVYEKAAALFVNLVKGHPFESGNRRTAYAVALDFVESNGFLVAANYDVGVIKGIRSGTHKNEQVAIWLRGHGK